MHLLSKDSIENIELKKLNYQKNFKNKDALTFEIQRALNYLKKEGYYTLFIERINNENKNSTAYLNLGQKILTATIHIPQNVKKNIIGYPIKKNKIELTANELPIFLEKLNSNLEKQGKGFSKFTLSKINIQNSSLIATLNLEEAIQRNADKIIIKGFQDFPKNYTKHFFKSGKKNLLNKKLLESISSKTNQLSFVSELKPPEILFSKDSTFIYVYLQKKLNNSFDGMLNFNSKEQGGGIELSGYVDLNLVNAFNFGEELRINWKNNGNEKQTLKLEATLPYLFNTSITSHIGFNLYKSDSTFLNNNITVALTSPIANNTQLGLQFQYESSKDLLNNAPDSIRAYQKYFIGPRIDFISGKQNNWKSSLQLLVGSKNELNQQTSQYKINISSNLLLDLAKRFELYINNSSGLLVSNNILHNENYRLGGINNFRGFREESIFATKYSFVNTEIRYRTQEKSYMYTLLDFGVFNQEEKSSFLYALGIGYAYYMKDNSIDLNYTYGISGNPTNTSLINVKFLTKF
ncbi:membrane protein [Polaribacter pacificus]|uniref:Membrane protein n=1 Tax=Polaribacter pacificus TaxID=1775173 RepID=A0A917HTU7_9FLAO|nr:membrane protein [Polaribacter pacificus]